MTSKEVNDKKLKIVNQDSQIGYKRMLFNETQDQCEESKMMMPSYLDDGTSLGRNSSTHNPSSKQIKKSSKGGPGSNSSNFPQHPEIKPRSVQEGFLPSKKQETLTEQQSVQSQNQQEGQQGEYDDFEDDSEEFELTSNDGIDDLLNVDYQMMFLQTVIQNSLDELVIEEKIFQENILQDIPRLRFILIQFHKKAIEKSVDDQGQFDFDRYQLLIDSHDAIHHFLFLEYPYLDDLLDEEEQIVRYQHMSDESFQDEYQDLHDPQNIQQIIEYIDLMDRLDAECEYEYFSPQEYSMRQKKLAEPGPLDNVMNAQNLFDNIDKFNKDNKNHPKQLKKSDKNYDVSIRRQKDNSKKQDPKTKKSNKIQLFNFSSISLKQSSNKDEKDNNNSNLTYQQFVALLQKQKQNQKSEKPKQLPEQDKTSQFDAILGKKPDEVSKNCLKPYIGEFSKKQTIRQTDLFNPVSQSNNIFQNVGEKSSLTQSVKNERQQVAHVQIPSQTKLGDSNFIPFNKVPYQQVKNCIPLTQHQGLSSNQNSTHSNISQASNFSPFNRNTAPLIGKDQYSASPPSVPNVIQPVIQPNSQIKVLPAKNNAFQQNSIPNPFSATQNKQFNVPNNGQIATNQFQNQTPSKNPLQRNDPLTSEKLSNPSFINLTTSSPQTPTFGASQQPSFSNPLSSAQKNPFSGAVGNSNYQAQIPVNVQNVQQLPNQFNTTNSSNLNTQPSILMPVQSQSNRTNYLMPQTQNNILQTLNTIPNPFSSKPVAPQLPVTINSQVNQNVALTSQIPQNSVLNKVEMKPSTQNNSSMSPQKDPEQNQNDQKQQKGNAQPKKITGLKTQKSFKDIYNEQQIMKMKVRDFIVVFCNEQMSLIYSDLFGELLLLKKWKLLNFGLDKEFYAKMDFLDKTKSQILFNTRKNRLIQANKRKEIQYKINKPQSLRLSVIEDSFVLMNSVSRKLKNAMRLSLVPDANIQIESLQHSNSPLICNQNENNCQVEALFKIQDEFQRMQKLQDNISTKLSDFEQSIGNSIHLERKGQDSEKICLTMNEELASMINAIKNTEKWFVQNNFCTVSANNQSRNFNVSPQNIRRSQNQEQNETSDFQALKLLYNNLDSIETNLQMMNRKLQLID